MQLSTALVLADSCVKPVEAVSKSRVWTNLSEKSVLSGIAKGRYFLDTNDLQKNRIFRHDDETEKELICNKRTFNFDEYEEKEDEEED